MLSHAVDSPYLFKAESHSIFTRLSADGHFQLIPHPDIVNGTAMNKGMLMSLRDPDFSSFG